MGALISHMQLGAARLRKKVACGLRRLCVGVRRVLCAEFPHYSRGEAQRGSFGESFASCAVPALSAEIRASLVLLGFGGPVEGCLTIGGFCAAVVVGVLGAGWVDSHIAFVALVAAIVVGNWGPLSPLPSLFSAPLAKGKKGN